MVEGAWTGMRTAAEQARLTPPRYRVELRVPGQAGFIVGFVARLSREGTAGEVVAVDQATEEVVERRTVRPGGGRGG